MLELDLFAFLTNYSLTQLPGVIRSLLLQLKDLLHFLTCLRSAERKHVTWLAHKRFTNSFQRIECDSLGLVLLQSPQCRMTYPGFFG